MIFALLTLLAALAVAAVAGWFSIIGVMAIYAGAPFHSALVMGVVLELAKLVTTSWIYRNWKFANWTLKGPLLYFTAALMLATSIGVFGFLSKAHLEQGAKTIDNGPRAERIEQQIAREKSIIADNEKVIAQLDATINSYLGKDRADRSVVIRKRQEPQRKQLKEEIDAANKRIDAFSEEKFKLQSEIRSLELEVGPIRYISELIYGTDGNSTKNIESAVKIFTLLIVSTLDPLAIILLVAANHSILRRQNEKKQKEEERRIAADTGRQELNAQQESITPPASVFVDTGNSESTIGIEIGPTEISEATIHVQVPKETLDIVDEEKEITEYKAGEINLAGKKDETPADIIREVLAEEESPTAQTNIEPEVQEEINAEEDSILEKFRNSYPRAPMPVIRSPRPSKVSIVRDNNVGITANPPVESKVQEAFNRTEIAPWAHQEAVLRELLGQHFIPQKINEEEKLVSVETPAKEGQEDAASGSEEEIAQMEQEGPGIDQNTQTVQSSHLGQPLQEEKYKYPKALSWLREFKRT